MSTEPAPKKAETAPVQGQRPETPQEDRWEVKRAENLITSLQGVLSARVVASPSGDITEVHVFTHGGTSPKQVVRNVESALLAHLGMKIDHRKISVAQSAEVKPIEALEETVVKEKAVRRALIFEQLEISPLERQRVRFDVRLRIGDDEVTASVEAADTPKARVQGAARAAVAAVDKLLPQGTIDLEGATMVEAFGTEFAFVAVYIVEGRHTRMVTGSCDTKDGIEQAAALAVLDATNRWTQNVV